MRKVLHDSLRLVVDKLWGAIITWAYNNPGQAATVLGLGVGGAWATCRRALSAVNSFGVADWVAVTLMALLALGCTALFLRFLFIRFQKASPAPPDSNQGVNKNGLVKTVLNTALLVTVIFVLAHRPIQITPPVSPAPNGAQPPVGNPAPVSSAQTQRPPTAANPNQDAKEPLKKAKNINVPVHLGTTPTTSSTTPPKALPSGSTTITVTSNNQQGGITAGQVINAVVPVAKISSVIVSKNENDGESQYKTHIQVTIESPVPVPEFTIAYTDSSLVSLGLTPEPKGRTIPSVMNYPLRNGRAAWTIHNAFGTYSVYVICKQPQDVILELHCNGITCEAAAIVRPPTGGGATGVSVHGLTFDVGLTSR